MEQVFLIRYGELTLKGGNKDQFIRKLKYNLKTKLKGTPTEIYDKLSRLYIRCNWDDREKIGAVLSKTFGIVGYTEAYKMPKDIALIEETTRKICASIRETNPGKKFRITVRRIDKKFPLDSYQLACRLGGVVLDDHPDLSVNLDHFDWEITCEVREAVYMYGPKKAAQKGLPAGIQGRGLLLLSGGIDSPVAGYLMAKRGLAVQAIFFHTPPYTSEKSLDKVKELSRILFEYLPSTKLHVVPFTEVQVKIKETAPAEEVTLLSRASMMVIADLVAKRYGIKCLVTGECLGQVASQTVESIAFTGSFTQLPVFRPLIGMDKEDIIAIALRIGSYPVSIQPYDDCCSLFAPAHPLIKPDLQQMKNVFDSLGLTALLEETASKTETMQVG